MFSACGSDSDDAATSTTGAAVTEAPPTTAESTSTSHDEHAAQTVTIGAHDYAFDEVPSTIAAGTSISFTNASTTELHELVAFKMPEGETRPTAELMALPPDELGAMFTGEPATVLIAPPTETGFAVVGDGTLTEPGRYLLICAIPVGADPQAYIDAAGEGDGPPEVEGGPPHFTVGMFAEVTVEPA